MDMIMVFIIEIVYDHEVTIPIKERLSIETWAVVIMKFDSDDINEYEEMVSILYGRGSYNYAL